MLAMMFLALLASLSVALISTSSLELKKSENLVEAQQAQLTAESGLTFMLYHLRQMQLPPGTTEADLLRRLCEKFQERLEGTQNLAGASIQETAYSGETALQSFRIPRIQAGSGSFTCAVRQVALDAGAGCRVTVEGVCGSAKRTVAMSFLMTTEQAAVFDYGVASRGRIVIDGSGTVTGMDDPSEAMVLSVRTSSPAIEVAGSGTVGEGLYVTGTTEDFVKLGNGGGYSVGGSSDPEAILEDFAHFGVEAPQFPTIDTGVFTPLATNVIDSDTDLTGSGNEWTNIRVRAGTNPLFTSDTVINGVMYVEYPNVVSFRGQVTVNGVIVTEESASPDYRDCLIEFRGGFAAPGVEALPEGDVRFEDLKKHTGTVILAPGFAMDFRGNSGTINGVIAADKLSFSGSSSVGGRLEGSILGLKDIEMTIGGSAEIRISRPTRQAPPAGFVHPMGFQAVADTYGEGSGG